MFYRPRLPLGGGYPHSWRVAFPRRGDGAVLDLDITGKNTSGTAYAVPFFTTTALDTDAVISVIAASTIADGDVILKWTTKPTTGSFVLSDLTLRDQYTLEIGESGLTVATRTGAAARVGETYYNSFAAAKTAANGKTIILLANVSDAITLSSGETLVVKKNGHKITKPTTTDKAFITESTDASGVTTYTAVPALTWNNSATGNGAWWNAGAWNDASGKETEYDKDKNPPTILPDIANVSEISISTWRSDTTLSPANIDVTATQTKYTLTTGSTAIKPASLTLEEGSALDVVMTKGGEIAITTMDLKSGSRFLMKTSGISTVGTANLADGSILGLDMSGSDSTSKTYTVPTFTTTVLDADASVSVLAASTIADGTVLLNWTTAPTTGSFVLSDQTLRDQYTLEIGTSGLSVETRTSAARVGTTSYYDTFADAKAAADGATIVLLADVTASATMTNGETVVVNKNGKTLNLTMTPKAGEACVVSVSESGDIVTYTTIPTYNITIGTKDRVAVQSVTTNGEAIAVNADGSYTVVSNAIVTVNLVGTNGYAYATEPYAYSVGAIDGSALTIPLDSAASPTVRVASSLYWIGSDRTWATSGNWALANGVVLDFQNNDSVTFTNMDGQTTETIATGADRTVGTLTVSATTTKYQIATGSKCLTAATVNIGAGAECDFNTTKNGTVRINTQLSVAENATVRFTGQQKFDAKATTFGNGSTLDVTTDGDSRSLGAVTLAQGVTVYVVVTNGTSVGDVPVSWTTAPTCGSFVLSDETLRKKFNLEITSTGLKVAAVPQYTITVPEKEHVMVASVTADIEPVTENGNGTYTVYSNATVTVTFGATAGYMLEGNTSITLAKVDGDKTISTDDMPTAKSKEGLIDEMQIVVDPANIMTLNGGTVGSVTTNADFTVSTPFALTGRGGLIMTNVDGAAVSKLTVSEGGILVLNPPHCPLHLQTAPVLNGKLALASEYKHNTIGKFTLMTWDDGAALSLPDDLDTVFTNTTMAGSFDLYVTNATWVSSTAKSLVLKLGNYDVGKRPLVLMPLGDSITEGAENTDCLYATYRLPLAAKLTAAGYDVTTVGWLNTKSNDCSNVAVPPEWQYHSGLGGERLTWTACTNTYSSSGKASTHYRGAIQESLEALLDQAGVPDVITFLIGTNDLQHEPNRFTAENYRDAVTNVLWRIHNYRPTTKVVISTLLDLNVGSPYDSQVCSNCVDVVRDLFAADNTYGFPEHFLYLNDAYDQIPRLTNGSCVNFLNKVNVHPSFVGHDIFSDLWFTAVTNALADTALEGTVLTNKLMGAAANVPSEYRNGFSKLASISFESRSRYTGTVPYSVVDASKTNHIARIAYYLELKRKDRDHRRFVWVDMNAFNDRTLAGMGLPTTYDRWGRVTNLHVYSNDPAVTTIAPTDNSAQGWMQFTVHKISDAETNLVTAVAGNPGCNDCNDTMGSDYGGVMQVFRLVDDKPWYRPPAETIFGYSGWANDAKYARSIGIGNFAQHEHGVTIDYYNVDEPTMDTDAYEVMNLEIWGVVQTAAEQAVTSYTWTGGGDGRLWTDIVNWGNANMYPGYGTAASTAAFVNAAGGAVTNDLAGATISGTTVTVGKGTVVVGNAQNFSYTLGTRTQVAESEVGGVKTLTFTRKPSPGFTVLFH